VGLNYPQLAEKDNTRSEAIDLTSYTFAKGCGICHPGGGPLEYDREGNRYDEYAENPKNNIISGDDNNFDGDYFQSKWAQSGVVEADCLLCHLKDYNIDARTEQIQSMNFRWSAVAGAGFADVKKTVAEGKIPEISYDLSLFDKNGKVTLPILREVQNRNCLFCHRESDWKKGGASFRARTDVHTRAGLRCTDCHVSAREASDPRIRGREVHQFGKGDNPDGFGRPDLNNSMRTCQDCHITGEMNAPIIKHRGLPPSHFDKIACQTCHIPRRMVRPIEIQDSTVFNPGARIPDPKRVWSFYGPDLKPFNFTGESSTYFDEIYPYFSFTPVIGRYKEKLYPLNRAYTIWMGIETQGQSGLNQVLMKELFLMWKQHTENPETDFPKLKEIKDDNQDGLPEVNRVEEIQALIFEVTAILKKRGRLSGRDKVVFVDCSQYTSDGVTWKALAKKPYEQSPYGSVFKLSHDITPAANALGAGGCKDCHSMESDFFFKDILVRPFNSDGQPEYQKNYEVMGYSVFAVWFMNFHHQVLKPAIFWIVIGGAIFGIFFYIIRLPSLRSNPIRRFATVERTIYFSALFLFGMQIIIGLTSFSATPFTAEALDKIQIFHKYLGYFLILNYIAVLVLWLKEKNSDVLHKILTICFLLIVIFTIVIRLLSLFNNDINYKLISNGLTHNAVFIASVIILAGICRIWKKKDKDASYSSH
jgi:hypothetical protein